MLFKFLLAPKLCHIFLTWSKENICCSPLTYCIQCSITMWPKIAGKKPYKKLTLQQPSRESCLLPIGYYLELKAGDVLAAFLDACAAASIIFLPVPFSLAAVLVHDVVGGGGVCSTAQHSLRHGPWDFAFSDTVSDNYWRWVGNS